MVHLCCQVIFSAKGLATDKTNHLVLFLSVLILVFVQLLEGLTGELVALQWQHPLRIPRFFFYLLSTLPALWLSSLTMSLQLIEISLWTLLKAQWQLERDQWQPPAIIIVCTSWLQRHTPMTQSLLQILERLEWECEFVFHTYFFFIKMIERLKRTHLTTSVDEGSQTTIHQTNRAYWTRRQEWVNMDDTQPRPCVPVSRLLFFTDCLQDCSQ